ncbi:TetR family transcriptional regulator [Spongiactinospora rosea]|uniref:TetR family transcriptional regulator n=1 Tax=Spongiactinospora rosea TaxID=2248750 RepID=A0A366LPL4_9ACTN|nr:TetR/AcrR family transcriptional regulator C-terminal domain-containing protein [Spongiactinospora rosea]RBQ15846.1 TetR family transcriptional regulator [Spongiactinospora rosea]
MSETKISPQTIARTSLRLLNETGLDGLSMRLVAKELGVRVSALYWHVRNKQELLDTIAETLFLDAIDGLEAPARSQSWDDWLRAQAGRLRHGMLRYRDGARVFAGTHLTHPALFRMTELTFRTLMDEGFTLSQASSGYHALYHYTVSYTIEEQARQGSGYGEENPYQRPLEVDPARYPLSAQILGGRWQEDPDAGFEDGVRLILAGMKATRAIA